MLGKKGFISVCALSLLLINTAHAQDTATKPNAQGPFMVLVVPKWLCMLVGYRPPYPCLVNNARPRASQALGQ